MSVHLQLLFSSAMITAIVSKTSPSPSGLAEIVCGCLLVGFVLLMRVQGIRKPVV